MSGDEQKRHCEKCATHVHDLTGLSAKEILAMRKSNGGKLCGVFRLSPAVGRPLALGSGIASLALASCTKEKEVALPGIVCEPPAREEPGENKPKREQGVTPAAANQTDASLEEGKPPEEIEVEQIRPMILGKICPENLPEPKLDSGPV